MPSQAQQIELGGSTFLVSPLPAMRSFALQPRIAPAVAEVMGALGEGAQVSLSNQQVEVIAPVVARFFLRMPAAELEAVTRELLQGASIDGMPLFTTQGDPFDVRMQGRTLDTWKLLWFAVRVNYPDFFDALAGTAARSEAQSPSAASST